MSRFDHAIFITNDSDLAELLQIVVQDAKLPLKLLNPVAKPVQILRELAPHVRFLQGHWVQQFSDPMMDQNRGEIRRATGG